MSGAPLLSVYPAPRLATLWPGRVAPRPLATDFNGLYFSCTEAVYWACRGVLPLLRAAGLPARLWLPAFHCGVEVEAALRAGFEVRYLHVGPRGELDAEQLAAALDAAPGAVMPIHYFGWAQPATARIAELCHARGVPLIADCAHAWWTDYEGRHVGDWAPVAVYSLRKWIGLYDGGALRVAPELLAGGTGAHFEPHGPLRLNRRPYVFMAKDLLRRALGERLIGTLRALRGGGTAADQQAVEAKAAAAAEANGESCEAPLAHPSLGLIGVFGRRMTALSVRLAEGVDPAWAAQRRRDHYRHLTRALEGTPGFAPLFEQLDAGACPLALPLRVPQRARLAANLRAAGIEPFIFGEYPHPTLPREQFPEARILRDTILCLPVHQDLSHEDLERIIASLKQLLPAHAVA